MNVLRRAGMTRQVAIGASVVALVAVAASCVLAVSMIRTAYDGQARETLQREAAFFATMDQNPKRPPSRPYGKPVQRLLAAGGVTVLRVDAQGRVTSRRNTLPRGLTAGLLPRPELPAGDATQAARGERVTGSRTIEGQRYLIASEPLANGNGSIVLLQRSSAAGPVAADVVRRLLLAGLIGLATAGAIGIVLARRVTRPLVSAARGAHRLAAGDREVRLEEEGPAEVAQLAGSLNSLATALALSERRQREFLLSISHELRTPLTAIGGFAEAIADGVATGDDAADAGSTIRAEAERMQRLVSDLLDLAQLAADDFRLDIQLVDLTSLMRVAAKVWAQRCAAVHVNHILELPDDSVWVQADAGRLRQVIDGLAENALRVTPEGGPIVFALRVDERRAEASMEVRDGGPGLRPEELAIAFDRAVLYERYRGVRRVGTGLGLALVNGLVMRLGGTARAGKASEGGACFTVTLPLASCGGFDSLLKRVQ